MNGHRPHPPLAAGGRRRPVGSDADLDAGPVDRTHRLGAKALVVDGDRVLLIEERRDDGSTFWTLPGGGVEPGESLRRCLRREVSEELQCGCRVGPLVTSCSYRHTSRPTTTTHYAVFGAALDAGPDPNTDEGVRRYEWRPPGRLPERTLAPFRAVVETQLG